MCGDAGDTPPEAQAAGLRKVAKERPISRMSDASFASVCSLLAVC